MHCAAVACHHRIIAAVAVPRHGAGIGGDARLRRDQTEGILGVTGPAGGGGGPARARWGGVDLQVRPGVWERACCAVSFHL